MPNLEFIVPELINGTPESCWCPLCKQDNQPAVLRAIWINGPASDLICHYGVCGACLAKMQAMSNPALSAACNGIEWTLTQRYPVLLAALPPDWNRNTRN